MAAERKDVIRMVDADHLARPAVDVPDANGSIWIPLNRLKDSPKNVRTVPHTEAHIRTLAALIQADRQIYPLVVEPEVGEAGDQTGFYEVLAGKGRRLAQLERVKQRFIHDDEPIWCLLGTAEHARETSIADNIHAPMHPADQFAAFKALLDGGKTLEEVAARFSVEPLVVRQRLKLANVAPEFVELFRRGELKIDHMMAFALTDDHAEQRTAWDSLPKANRSADWLRRALVKDEQPLASPIAKFVGVAAYERAGGAIRRDLFDTKEGGYIVDVALLMRLASEKLEKAAARLKKQGCAWAEARLHLDYSDLQEFGRVQTVLREPSEQESGRLADIATRRAQLETEAEEIAPDDDQRLIAHNEALEALEAEVEGIENARSQPDAEQQKIAGAIVTIDHSGRLRIERGLLLPADKKRIAKQTKAQAKTDGKGNPARRTHSAALLLELTAHKTLALQAVLADRPDVALVALTHRLVMETFSAYSRAESAVEVTAEHTDFERYADDIKQAKAYKVFAERKAALKSQLPRKADALFAWLLKQPQSEVLALLAFCVASSLNGVRNDELPGASGALANATGLDMREWWNPTAANYFGRIPKDTVIDIVTKALSPEAAGALRVLKRKSAAEVAEERMASTGWLPDVLKTRSA